MISAQDLFNKYKGQVVGTNPSDTGQCVGFFNVGMRDQTGIGGYILQGAYGAKDLMTCTNTRPDLVERVINNPNDLLQKPSPGDWVVWNGNLPGSGGYGHVALCLSTPPKQIITGDSNWGGAAVHQVTHDWSYVAGWIHHKIPAPIVLPPDPCAGVKADNEVLKQTITDIQARLTAADKTIVDLKAQLAQKDVVINDYVLEVNGLIAEVATLKKVIEAGSAENARLRAQIGDSTKWQTLKSLIKELIS